MIEKGMNVALLNYACDIIADTNNGLTGTKIIKYSNNFSLDFDVKIPYSTYPPQDKASKKKMLFSNLCCFNEKQQVSIISFLCNLSDYKDRNEIENLKNKMAIKYPSIFGEIVLESELIVETKKWLSDYPEVLELYESSLKKYSERTYIRNALDDMRLSLELLLKKILNNDKSLENQFPNVLGNFLKDKGVSTEIRNVFLKIIECYSMYQNEHVKHNDSVNELEVEYIIEQTSVLMKLLLKIK